MKKPLTIGVDIRDLRVSKTGIRTYLEELCIEFKKMESPLLRFHFMDSSLPVYKGQNKFLKLTEHAKYQWWKQIALPLKALFKGCDVLYCTDNFVPLIHLGYQTVPVFHDAFFFENPENYGRLWLSLYMKTALPAAKRSPFVVTDTYHSQKQLNQFTDIPIKRLPVVYAASKLADNIVLTEKNSSVILEKFNLKPGAYLFHAGAAYKRKNLTFLINALARLKTDHPEMKLVLSGPMSVNSAESDFDNITQTIAANGLENDVVMPGYISKEELAALYNSAALYVFPSLNEGFGIPVLEAFEHNLPVLVADNTCLPEVGGEATITFNPLDLDDLVTKLKMVLDDQDLRNQMIAKGHKRLKDFSWNKAALELIEIFKQAAKHS